MNRITLYLASLLLFSLSLFYFISEESQNDKIITGFIIEENDLQRTFYIQDKEAGNFVELYFANEYLNDLSFEDFDQVEVIGKYNKYTNILNVHEILMLDEVKNTMALLNQ